MHFRDKHGNRHLHLIAGNIPKDFLASDIQKQLRRSELPCGVLQRGDFDSAEMEDGPLQLARGGNPDAERQEEEQQHEDTCLFQHTILLFRSFPVLQQQF
jgi:hypothetical protein